MPNGLCHCSHEIREKLKLVISVRELMWDSHLDVARFNCIVLMFACMQLYFELTVNPYSKLNL